MNQPGTLVFFLVVIPDGHPLSENHSTHHSWEAGARVAPLFAIG